MNRHHRNRRNQENAKKKRDATSIVSAKPARPPKQVAQEAPFGIWYFRTLGGAGFLASVLGVIQNISYFWSVSLIYATIIFGVLDFACEPRLGRRWRGLLVIPLGAFFVWFTFHIVLNSAKIESSVRAVGAYKADAAGNVWGVPWQPFYYGLDLTIRNPSTSEDYSNLDFMAYSDLPLVEFALKTPRGCEDMSLSHIQGSGDLTDMTAHTTQVAGVPNGMELRCKRIAKKEFLSFLLAMYPLDQHRKSIYEPLLPIKPSWVEIKGSFETTLGKRHEMFAHIPVPEPERPDSSVLQQQNN